MSTLVADIRRLAGLTQVRLAQLAGTSQPAIAAYETGAKSPSVDTVERIGRAAGFTLVPEAAITWRMELTKGGRPFFVPNRLTRLAAAAAFGRVQLPLLVYWSEPGKEFDLSRRKVRLSAYEVILREGRPEHFEAFVDGALLVDLWDEMVVPREVHAAWQPLIDSVRGK